MRINTDVLVFLRHQLVLTKDTWVVAVYVAVVQDERDAFQFPHLRKQVQYDNMSVLVSINFDFHFLMAQDLQDIMYHYGVLIHLSWDNTKPMVVFVRPFPEPFIFKAISGGNMNSNNIFQHTVHVHALYGVTKVEK